jgi:hypothetical protein
MRKLSQPLQQTPLALILSKGRPSSRRCKKRQGLDKLSLSGLGAIEGYNA